MMPFRSASFPVVLKTVLSHVMTSADDSIWRSNTSKESAVGKPTLEPGTIARRVRDLQARLQLAPASPASPSDSVAIVQPAGRTSRIGSSAAPVAGSISFWIEVDRNDINFGDV